eukprot:1023929-Heterocapsa_arctica.AAC.1
MKAGQIGNEAEDTNPAIENDEPKRLQQIMDKCCIGDQANLSTKGNDGQDKYPGVSSQKRVRLRAEQLFQEEVAKTADRKQEVFVNRQHKKAE